MEEVAHFPEPIAVSYLNKIKEKEGKSYRIGHI